MGMDIHVFVERRNKRTGAWESLCTYSKEDDGSYTPCPVYVGRNYELFELLGSGRGSFRYPSYSYGHLVANRGLPNDPSPDVVEEWGDGAGYFSATWYDFCELDAYGGMLNEFDKTVRRKNRKIADLENQLKKFLTNESENDIIDYDEYEEEDEEATVSDSLSNFVDNIREVIGAYHIYNPMPGDVRIVIWFDN